MKILLVQTCHIPHLHFILGLLREKHPEWEVELLLVDHPQVRSDLGLFSGHRIHFLGSGVPVAENFERIVLPLLNRGYRKMKQAVGRLPARLWRIDYEGRLEEVSRLDLWLSILRPVHSPSPKFAQYLERFPHRLLGEKILFAQSAHDSLIEQTRAAWSRLIPEQAEVTRLREGRWRDWMKLRDESFDSAVVFFSGESGYWQLRLLPFLLKVPTILVVNENGSYFYADVRSLARFLFYRIAHGPTPPRLSPRILFIQTEAPDLVRQSIRALRQEKLFPECEILLVCREEDRQELNSPGVRLLSYSRRRRGQLRPLLREVRSFEADVAVANFTGRPLFRKQKLLFLLPIFRRRLVFNAQLDCYELSWRTFPRLFRKDTCGLAIPQQKALLLYSGPGRAPDLAGVVGTIQKPHVANVTQVDVLCLPPAVAAVETVKGIRTVYVWEPGRWRSNWSLIRSLYEQRPDVISATISWRSLFKLPDLLFFLLPAHGRLVINANLDCEYLRWRRLLQLLATSSCRGVLLIQSEEDEQMLRAARTLAQPHVARSQEVFVLCREDKRKVFEGLDLVKGFVTYRKGSLPEYLRVFRKALSLKVAVVAAVFSGRPVYRACRLLFFLIPAPGRLVFNQNLDCFYLSRKTYNYLFDVRTTLNKLQFVRTTLKVLLFFPRLIYLVTWITALKLKRAYILLRLE